MREEQQKNDQGGPSVAAGSYVPGTSEALNAKIRDVQGMEEMPYVAYGGKPIPYIGWYWRDVDFDADTYAFGVLPDGRRGFMENNKWGYRRVWADEEEWARIRDLLVEALDKMDRRAFLALDEAIQRVGT